MSVYRVERDFGSYTPLRERYERFSTNNEMGSVQTIIHGFHRVS